MTFGSLRCSRPTLIWVAGTLGVVAVFGRLAVHNLGNYRPLSNDEGELMSVGYKLATQGVLGSDMFAVAICLSVMLLEGLHAYVVDWQQAATVTPYVPLGSEIDAAIPASATVLGPERWWWALHSHPYLSLRSTWYQWTAQSSSGGSPQFSDWVHAQSIVVNVNVRADIQAFPAPLQEQFWSFVAHCTTRVAAIPNPNYFETEIYSVTPGCS